MSFNKDVVIASNFFGNFEISIQNFLFAPRLFNVSFLLRVCFCRHSWCHLCIPKLLRACLSFTCIMLIYFQKSHACQPTTNFDVAHRRQGLASYHHCYTRHMQLQCSRNSFVVPPLCSSLQTEPPLITTGLIFRFLLRISRFIVVAFVVIFNCSHCFCRCRASLFLDSVETSPFTTIFSGGIFIIVAPSPVRDAVSATKTFRCLQINKPKALLKVHVCSDQVQSRATTNGLHRTSSSKATLSVRNNVPARGPSLPLTADACAPISCASVSFVASSPTVPFASVAALPS